MPKAHLVKDKKKQSEPKSHPWSKPFSPNAPLFPNRAERTALSHQRSGQQGKAIQQRWATYRRQGLPIPTGKAPKRPRPSPRIDVPPSTGTGRPRNDPGAATEA